MKNLKVSHVCMFLFILLFSTGMEVVGDILEAGLWITVILVVLFILLIVWLIRKFLG